MIKMKIEKPDCRINKQLYLDGLRQLKLVGIMGMVVFCAAALLTALGFHINSPLYWEMNEWGEYIEYYRPTGVSLYQCNWVLFASFPVLVPVMTTILFKFLNHRNASDFYHAIPDTRGTLYVSYAAAILTWVGAIIAVSTILSVGLISIIPGYYMIWSGVPKSLFMITAACILVMGGLMISLGLTGTRMSNLMVAVMILFLPRIFITAITGILEDMLGFVAWEYSPSLLNCRYNIVAGLPLALFSQTNPLEYWSSGVYTLIVGLIYLMIGYVVFVRRKSESAGHAAITKKLQTVFRLAVSLTICLVPIYFMTDSWADRYTWSADDIFFVFVFYVIAVLAYFIYELMTTGKLRGFKKLCKGLVVLAGLNVALFALIIGIYSSVVGDTPDGDQIDYIMIIGDDDDYFESQLEKIRVRDDEVAEITANALRRTIDGCTRNSRIGADYDYSYDYDEYGKPITHVIKTIGINVGMRTIYRDIRFTQNEWSMIAQSLEDMPEYRQVYTDLPEYRNNETRVSSWRGQLTDEKMAEVYKVMREEVKEIDFAAWYTELTNLNYGGYLDMIQLYVTDGSGSYYGDWIELPILPSMSRTIQCYLNQLDNSVESEEKSIWTYLSEIIRTGVSADGERASFGSLSVDLELIGASGGTEYVNLSNYIEAYRSDDTWKSTVWGDMMNEENTESLLTFVDKLYAEEYPIDTTAEMWLMVHVYAYVGSDLGGKEQGLDRNFCISLSEPIPEEIKDMLGKYVGVEE